MKKILLTLLLFVPLCFWLYRSFNKQAPNKQENVLVVGTDANFAPFEFIKDGKMVGLEIDLMNEIGLLLGKKIVFKDMPFDSLLMEAESGRLDVIAAAMTPTEERGKKVLFTKPYLTDVPLLAITIAPNAPKNIADLIGKEVIVNDGYTTESYIKQQEGISVKSLGSPAEAFLALLNNKAYAYISARSAAQPFFDQYGKDKFNILELPKLENSVLAVPKSKPQIFELIEGALLTLEKNGTIADLRKKWNLD